MAKNLQKFYIFLKMNKKTMLEAMINHFADGNKAKFASMVGISPQNLSHWLARGSYDPEALYAKLVGISATWLLSGRGEMLEKQNGNLQNGNSELLAMCRLLVENYKQRDEVMSKLVSILG